MKKFNKLVYLNMIKNINNKYLKIKNNKII